MTATSVSVPLADWTAIVRQRRELLAALKTMLSTHDRDYGHGSPAAIGQAQKAIIEASSIRIVDGENKGAIVPLAEFLAVNDFGDDERAAIVDAMIAEKVYAGGGGAAPAWRIEPAEFLAHLTQAG